MATALVYKVRDADGVLVASLKQLNDAAIVASRHGQGAKICHMHFGVLATVESDVDRVGLWNRAGQKLDEKRRKMLAEHEASLERERQRRAKVQA